MQRNYSSNMSMVREHNQLALLEAIFSKSETSRTLLAKELNISKPSISDNLEYLIQVGIVEEIGEGQSASNGGRKPRLLRFNGNHKYIIAIELNYSKPFFALGNLNGQIISEFEVTVEPSADTEAFLSIIKNGIKILLASHSISDDGIASIAISSPGMFDNEGKLCGKNPSYKGLPWANIDIKPYLTNIFNIPVIIKTDILAATVGEWNLNPEKPDDMIFLGCGLGLGAGIILNGNIFEGKYFSAGQLYNYIDKESLQKGITLEDRICMKELIRTISLAETEGHTTILRTSDGEALSFSDIVEAYNNKNSFVLEQIQNIGDELGIIAMNLMSFLSIHNLVIGGEYAVFGETLMQSISNILSTHSSFSPTVNISSHGRYSGIYGMFHFARQDYFRRLCKKADKVYKA